jgi:glucose-6-phosphate-specific signal transduction histidine kinase
MKFGKGFSKYSEVMNVEGTLLSVFGKFPKFPLCYVLKKALLQHTYIPLPAILCAHYVIKDSGEGS